MLPTAKSPSALLCTFLITVLPLTVAVAIPDATAPLASPVALGVGRPDPTCVPDKNPGPDWTTQRWLVEDCYVAIQDFYHSNIRGSDTDKQHEFLAPRTNPVTKLPNTRTPTKWSHGTCTMTIILLRTVMESMFQSDLPGLRTPSPRAGPLSWPTTDVETFGKLYEAVKDIEEVCLHRQRLPGWVQLGMGDGMGIMVWASGSSIDQIFPPGSPRTGEEGEVVIPVEASK